MEIVDAQVHANLIVPPREGLDLGGSVEATVAVMDAVGVDAMVVDEWTGWDEAGNHLPGARAANGAWRTFHPFATEAMRRYPRRFALLGRIDHRDPELDQLMADVRAMPGRLGLRLTRQGASEISRIERGEYDALFALAEKHQVPLCANLGVRPEVIGPYLDKHPGLRFALDHLGVHLPENDDHLPDRFTRFERVIALARHPNLYVKWCHVERISLQDYPFSDILPVLRRVADAFGPERIMWAGDVTQSRNPSRSAHPCNWGEALHYLLDSDLFSKAEKEWIFGRTVRSFLRWT